MRRVGNAAVAAVVAWAFWCCGEAHAQASSAAPVAEEARVETTTSPTLRMLVPVMIGASGPHHFIVDTAAERTVIAEDLALELNLPSAGSGSLLSMTDRRAVGMVSMREVTFGLGPARSLLAFTLSREHVGAAGVLGIDALRDQRIVLDFERSELRAAPASRRPQRAAPEEIVVRGRSRYGQLILTDSVVDGARIDVVLDSGLDISVGNSALWRVLTSRRGQFRPMTLVSITGEAMPAEYTLVDNLRIGGLAIRGLPIAFADAYVFRRLRLLRRPALLLGVDALREFRSVSVDFPNRRAYFVLPERVENSEAEAR